MLEDGAPWRDWSWVYLKYIFIRKVNINLGFD